MNPVARLSADSPPGPRGESPTPGATRDADPIGFGLALALAAAAQPQAPPPAHVVVPAHGSTGDAGGSEDAEAPRASAENVMGARGEVPRTATPAPAPSPASPEGSEANVVPPLPVTTRDTQDGFTPGAATRDPARPEPVRPEASPSVAAEAAAAASEPSPRTADLPLNVRVLELVRGMTEQAARVALDTAMSAGPARDVAIGGGPVPAPTAADRGRGRSGEDARDGGSSTRAAGAMLAEASAAAPALLADGSAPVFLGPGSPIPQSVHPRAGSADPAAEAERAPTVPPEARTSARPGDQITLHFSGEDGLEGQLRVAVRGQNVRATILSQDPVTAERLSRGLGELQRALVERGFSEARLNVQHAARNEGPASGAPAREDARGDQQPRGGGRDRNSSSRQQRESSSTDENLRRRPSRPRTERQAGYD
jgi:hypothetical protein